MTAPTVTTDTGASRSGTDAPTELAVTGMSCASCAARVESALNDRDGVTATVNYATSSAYISRGPDGPAVDELIAVVEGLGYGANPAPAAGDDLEAAAEAQDAEAAAHVADLKLRFWVSAALALPVMLISMIPAWQFRGWQWVVFALTTPVVVWVRCPSTGPRSSTSATGPRRWTPWSRSGSSPRTPGRSGRCSSAGPACWA